MIIELKQRFEAALSQSLMGEHFSTTLHDALAYALKGSGKRLRPLLVLSSALSLSSWPKNHVIARALPAALAIEYVHTYSLIHDDLPAMDNDDYRRGRLSLHRRFNEAVAILAGDALLADAFALVARALYNPALLCLELSMSAGRNNLVGGQTEDLASNKKYISQKKWLEINAKKTARLFEASAVMGALSVDITNIQKLSAVRRFGYNLGVAFQLKDDLDDGEFINSDSKSMHELLSFHMKMARDAALLFDKPKLVQDYLEAF